VDAGGAPTLSQVHRIASARVAEGERLILAPGITFLMN